jgi:hypothetical protein
MDRVDLFAEKVPGFNFEGKTNVSSYVGLGFSVLLYLFMFGYATSRVAILLSDGNPIMSTYDIKSEYGLKQKIDLDDYGFQIAFQVRRIDLSNEPVVHDPDFVDYAVYLSEKDADGKKKKTPVAIHKCEAKDYERFAVPQDG